MKLYSPATQYNKSMTLVSSKQHDLQHAQSSAQSPIQLSQSPMQQSDPIIPRVLSIAGTDPTGGAGIQADLKSIMAAGGYGMCIPTNLVAQNTCEVREVFTPPVSFFRTQLSCMYDDVTVDALKIGMLGCTEYIEAMRDWMCDNPVPVSVLDPVMISTSGKRLLEASAENAMRNFISCVDVVTPNVPELAALCESRVAENFEEACNQARKLAAKNSVVVIVKGGHLTSEDVGNTAVFPDGDARHVPSERVETSTTHGTGCSLSSALATKIGLALREEKNLSDHDTVLCALEWSTAWLREAIAAGSELHVGRGGERGHGPVNHSVRILRQTA